MVTGFVFCLCIIILFSVLCWWLCVNIDLCDISFSDQEPPYSMITLHEMAETGIKALWWAFQLGLISKRNKTNPKPLFSLQREIHLSQVCWDVATRTQFCPSELHWARVLAWVFLNSVKLPTWSLQKQPGDGHKHTVVALSHKEWLFAAEQEHPIHVHRHGLSPSALVLADSTFLLVWVLLTWDLCFTDMFVPTLSLSAPAGQTTFVQGLFHLWYSRRNPSSLRLQQNFWFGSIFISLFSSVGSGLRKYISVLK